MVVDFIIYVMSQKVDIRVMKGLISLANGKFSENFEPSYLDINLIYCGMNFTD